MVVDPLAGDGIQTCTFDNPVVLLPKPDADESTPLAMASNGGVYLPLDRRMGLLLTEHDFGVELPGTTARAREYNQWAAWNAHRAVFHHPDDHAIWTRSSYRHRESRSRGSRSSRRNLWRNTSSNEARLLALNLLGH
jgi:hypothetical protein